VRFHQEATARLPPAGNRCRGVLEHRAVGAGFARTAPTAIRNSLLPSTVNLTSLARYLLQLCAGTSHYSAVA
jgi:hypothetical protein